MNNYIFTHEGVQKFYRGEIPQKPEERWTSEGPDYEYNSDALEAYESSLESIRTKGVEIAAMYLQEKIDLKKGEFYKVECEVIEQFQMRRHQTDKHLKEWTVVDKKTYDNQKTSVFEYRTVVYLSPKKEQSIPNPEKTSIGCITGGVCCRAECLELGYCKAGNSKIESNEKPETVKCKCNDGGKWCPYLLLSDTFPVGCVHYHLVDVKGDSRLPKQLPCPFCNSVARLSKDLTNNGLFYSCVGECGRSFTTTESDTVSIVEVKGEQTKHSTESMDKAIQYAQEKHLEKTGQTKGESQEELINEIDDILWSNMEHVDIIKAIESQFHITRKS